MAGMNDEPMCPTCGAYWDCEHVRAVGEGHVADLTPEEYRDRAGSYYQQGFAHDPDADDHLASAGKMIQISQGVAAAMKAANDSFQKALAAIVDLNDALRNFAAVAGIRLEEAEEMSTWMAAVGLTTEQMADRFRALAQAASWGLDVPSLFGDLVADFEKMVERAMDDEPETWVPWSPAEPEAFPVPAGRPMARSPPSRSLLFSSSTSARLRVRSGASFLLHSPVSYGIL